MIKVIRAVILAVAVALLLVAILAGFSSLGIVVGTAGRRMGAVGPIIILAAFVLSLLHSLGVFRSYREASLSETDELRSQSSASLSEITVAVHESCLRLRMPKVSVFQLVSEDGKGPWLMAAAYPPTGAIGISLDLKRSLNACQIDAVIAHEFGHIFGLINDFAVPLSSLKRLFFLTFVIGELMEAAVSLAARVGLSKAPPRSVEELLLPASLVGGVYVSAMLIHWLEEFDADLYSGVLTKEPSSLLAALKKFKQQDKGLRRNRAALFANLAEFSILPSHPPYAARIWLVERVFSLRG